jgi:hypothetical protein
MQEPQECHNQRNKNNKLLTTNKQIIKISSHQSNRSETIYKDDSKKSTIIVYMQEIGIVQNRCYKVFKVLTQIQVK